MTDTTNTTEPTPTDTPADTDPADTIDTQTVDDTDANSEAAKYRRRLRDTEAERDRLATVVDKMRRQAVEAIAADIIAAPADVWLAGLDLADLLTADGDLDTEATCTAIEQLAAERPHWANTAATVVDIGQGPRGAARLEPAPSWSQIINPRA